MSRTLAATMLLGVALAPAAARANPDSLVPTLSPPGSYIAVQGSATNIFGRVDYDYEIDRSNIMREETGGLVLAHDLVYRQTRHTITPRIEIGLLKDTWIYGALPIVVTQSSELRLDSGVTKATSSTFGDMLLPAGGYDAQDPSTPPAGDLAFRGVSRHGLDQLHLGIGVAPMNQARDDTKPTWKLGAEARIAVGGIARFDPTAPDSNHAVGYGVHELRLWTSFDRRLGWAEPYLELWWQVPLASKDNSPFTYPVPGGQTFGAQNTQKGEQAGVSFGFEAYAIDTPDRNRISLELGARAIAHFEGRDYSEMWEVFALAGNANMGGPLVLDADPTTTAIEAMSHPGITNVENYLETTAHVAVRAELGEHVRFAVLGDAVWKSDHVITFADAGVDRNGNDLVDPNSTEVNPLHVDKIDLVGHRFHSVHGFGVIIGVQGQVLF